MARTWSQPGAHPPPTLDDVSRVLLLAPDVPPAPGALAAGPGIRYGELAAVLRGAGHAVTLAAPERGADAVWSPGSVAALAAGHSAVVLGQGHADLGRAVARSLPPDLPVVVDCYAPGIIEAIALNDDPGMFPGFLARTVELLKRGDLFLVANAAQRLYTLGLLSASGRLNPTTYDDPPLLEIPFGVPVEPPGPVRARVGRGVLVPEDAALVLSYGGVYPWFDCATAVRRIRPARSSAFRTPGSSSSAGVIHAPTRRTLVSWRLSRPRRSSALASASYRLPGGPTTSVSPGTQRPTARSASTIAGSRPSCAHRTRLVDLLWGRVPVISSAGDVVGERAAAAGAGVTVLSATPPLRAMR